MQYYFFLKNNNFESYQKKPKNLEDLKSLDEQIGRFILSENQVAYEGNEEIRFQRYQLEENEGHHLDNLFDFLLKLDTSSHSFSDSLGNILRIADSFFCSCLLRISFMKYLFANSSILRRLVEWSANYQAAIFIHKLLFHRTDHKTLTEHQQFCYDKIELCRLVLHTFVETEQPELFENLQQLVLQKLLAAHSDDLHDAETILDCAILAKSQSRPLFEKLAERVASHGFDDAKSQSLVEILTSVCGYLQRRLDSDGEDVCEKSFMSNQSSSPRPDRRKYSLDPSEIPIECEKCCVLAEDEFISLLQEHISVVLALVSGERMVVSSDSEVPHTHQSDWPVLRSSRLQSALHLQARRWLLWSQERSALLLHRAARSSSLRGVPRSLPDLSDQLHSSQRVLSLHHCLAEQRRGRSTGTHSSPSC